MKLHCGCSGYQYPEWKGSFYPNEIPKKNWLPYYAEQFSSVEINNTFYGLPTESTVQRWHDSTPDDFCFAVKGSQYITHQKKLKHDHALEEALQRFSDAMSPLREKLHCILWQLPRNLHLNADKLRNFCELLPEGPHYIFEFRHPSWFTEEVYEILQQHHYSCCALSSPDEELPECFPPASTPPYLRFHGKEEWYHYNYTKQELEDWAQALRELNAEEGYVYFNNTASGDAPDNAWLFRELIG